MAAGFPVKADYASGDVLTAAQMNDLSGTLNYLDPTAKGDLFPASSGTALTRLAVGANDTVLTADSSTATGLKWAASSSGGTSYTLLNAGGTALTGASTITVSGISNQDKLFVIIDGASSDTAAAFMVIRFNADSGSNYYRYGYRIPYSSAASNYELFAGVNTSLQFADNIAVGNVASAGINILGAKGSGVKIYDVKGASSNQGSNFGYNTNGYYDSSSTISSVSVITGAGNFDAGTIYVYGSTN